MYTKFRFIVTTIILSFFLANIAYSQELDEVVEELKEPLELTDEQEGQFSKLLGEYGVLLNEAMDKNEDSGEEADPKKMISQFKSVRDAYREDLQKIRDMCTAQDIPFFFKQFGNWGPDGVKYRSKKDAGNELDGQIHEAYPVVADH